MHNALQAIKDIARIDIEAPYFNVTVITVPDCKDIAFITRTHHILGEVFSIAILFRDVESALRGETVVQGTRWADFARFMVTTSSRTNRRQLLDSKGFSDRYRIHPYYNFPHPRHRLWTTTMN
ncbi:hypothetical protein N7495_009874 [Penicillium taxi]|uniref:uncharacterized protein n=1 Tax=Penicillium taxi TaxID=168475 RepID=UPI002545326C|nr:uncharacterized protein N7495_009874 [Penicillium taxi]KAJ5885364.1 hypothetical protein N7495_009874 [Penicillium taxi]